jgi:hypothetical protein
MVQDGAWNQLKRALKELETTLCIPERMKSSSYHAVNNGVVTDGQQIGNINH